MAVAGTALAVGAGTTVAVVTNGGDGPSATAAPTAQNVAFTTAALENRTVQVSAAQRLRVNGMRYVQISGHTDPAVQERVNAALRAPVERALEAARSVIRQNPEMGRPGIQCDGAEISAEAVPGLRTGRLVSVRYELKAGWVCNTDFVSTWAVTATVALDSGKALTLEDIFTPQALTQAGLATLWSRVPKPTPGPGEVEECPLPARIAPSDLRPDSEGIGDAAVDIGFTAQGMTVTSQPAELDDFCTFTTMTVPYDRVRDLLQPKFAELLPR
ncbi:hypothetical protein EIO00_22905 [Thermomonospora catenispora]|nr:hypothetical protein EIO00_22905 [Thermomonospora catenispora]